MYLCSLISYVQRQCDIICRSFPLVVIALWQLLMGPVSSVVKLSMFC